MTRIEREGVSVPIIIQAVGGDLRVRGRDDDMLIVEGDHVEVEQIGDNQPYLVRGGGDCRITVPDDVDVIVQEVGGDAKLTDLGGKVEISNIGADLTLRNVTVVHIKNVGADLRIKRADGDITIDNIGSDATIREVAGAVWITNIGSDLYLRNVDESCVVENVGSDLVVNIDFHPDLEYRFRAGSTILCRVEPDANARFFVPAELDVVLDIPAELVESEDGTQQIITMGEGSATIVIEDGDELRLVTDEQDYVVNLSAQIEEELDARLSNLEEKLSQQLEGLDERIRVKAEVWSTHAERLAERAQEQAQRAMERARRSLERQTRRKRSGPRAEFRWEWDSAGRGRPARPSAPVEPVKEEERMMILKMVQDQKISIEEAERLLAALEGQD